MIAKPFVIKPLNYPNWNF